MTKLSFLAVFALCSCVSVKHPPKASSDDNEALIVEAMKKPVEQESGTRVTFSGTTKVSGDWAYFDGHAFPADGSEPAGDMTLDFAALLRRDSRRAWQVLDHGFSGDPSLIVHLRKTHPEAPVSIFPSNTDQLVKLWPMNHRAMGANSRRSWSRNARF
ncbi:MAG: hypothetical protein IPK32_04845 [Verrucomicrobiaceae bacterium]|nr:hypothetical protein [Verrucomicrobiaceae bacterium]